MTPLRSLLLGRQAVAVVGSALPVYGASIARFLVYRDRLARPAA